MNAINVIAKQKERTLLRVISEKNTQKTRQRLNAQSATKRSHEPMG